MRPRQHRETGQAMVAALALVTLVTTLTTTLATLAREALVLARFRDAAVAGVLALDRCAATIVSGVAPGWGVTGLALPVVPACTATAIATGSSDRASFRITATHAGGMRSAQMVVDRHPDPGVRAVLWVDTLPSPDAICDGIRLVGDPATPFAAIATTREPEVVDRWLGETQARLTLHRVEAAIVASAPPIADLVHRIDAIPHGDPSSVIGSHQAVPGLWLTAGDLVIDRPTTLAGALIVDGVLDIRAPLAFTGLLAASGAVRVGANGRLDVGGEVWVGDGRGIDIAGPVTIQASDDALAGADALVTLPRRLRWIGLRDQP